MDRYVGAIDQGTTSTRFMIFDHEGREVARHQLEHEQIMPRPGWVEHDATEIWRNTCESIEQAMAAAKLGADDLAAIGITNQRETTVLWDKTTGEPCAPALVWQDTRTEAIIESLRADGLADRVKELSGLPPAAYFSAGKIRWILDNVEAARSVADAGNLLAGTIDSWVLWNLTGGIHGGVHATDVTNASRTMLMNLHTLDWDDELLTIFDIDRSWLAQIKPSSADFGSTCAAGPFGAERPICGIVGDQHAALLGQACFEPGMVKNTYGTGNFVLLNTGEEPVMSDRGLLTTVAYQLPGQPAIYALEGSIAVTGSAIQWLRDQLGLIVHASETEELAAGVDDNGGVVFVPAFSGLFAPHWRPDARGAIVGLSRYNTKAHIARATLEAICHQSREVIEAMVDEAGLELAELRVDGGATANDLLMQIQADTLNITVTRPDVIETTCLGAAYAAGLYAGFWNSVDELTRHWQADRQWEPQWSDEQRDQAAEQWSKAIDRTLNWA